MQRRKTEKISYAEEERDELLAENRRLVQLITNTNFETLRKKNEIADHLIAEQTQLIDELKVKLRELEQLKAEFNLEISQGLRTLKSLDSKVQHTLLRYI